MDWRRVLAYITGTVDEELLLRNEYLAAENRILLEQLQGRLRLTDLQRKTLAEIGCSRRRQIDHPFRLRIDQCLSIGGGGQ